MLGSLGQDVRWAARSLAQRQTVLVSAVLCLGIGIAGTAVLTGLLDALLLRPPAHVRDPGQIVRLYPWHESGLRVSRWASFPLYELMRDNVTSLSSVAAYASKTVVIGGGAGTRDVAAELVTWNYFDVLGVDAAEGRFFGSGDKGTGSMAAVVIGYSLWQTAFGASADALGKSVRVGGRVFTIVGVAPRGFAGIDRARVDVWLPLEAVSELVDPGALSSSGLYWLEVFGRLAAAASESRVSEEATALFRWADRDGPSRDARIAVGRIGPEGARGARAAEVRLLLWTALSSMLLLLIACANVANLMLVRFLGAAQDLATRAALGASRGRLIRLAACEVAVLAMLAGILAACIVEWSGGAVRALLAPDVDVAGLGLDVRSASHVGALTLVAGVLTALPALVFVFRRHDSAHRYSRGHAQSQRAAAACVAVQCAISMVLLIGAGVLGRSLKNVSSLELGLDTDRVLYASADLRSDLSRADAVALYDMFAEGVAAIPGVESVTVAMGLPLRSVWAVAVTLPAEVSSGRNPVVLGHAVGQGYFSTTGLRVTMGRPFEPWEHTTGASVAIINESFARRFWPAESPLGACLRLGSDTECQNVVGVVVDTPRSSVTAEREYELYIPLKKEGGFGMKQTLALAVRARADPYALTALVRSTMESTSESVVYAAVTPVSAILAPQLRPWRIGTVVFTGFSAVAVLLAGVGIYGLLAFVVVRERHAMCIRMALGAMPSMVRRSVVVRGIALCTMGTAIGLLTAAILAPAGESLLFGVAAHDPMVFGGAAAVILSTAIAASWLAARRVARLDVVSLLRQE